MQPENQETIDPRETMRFPKAERQSARIEKPVTPERAREVAEAVREGIAQSYEGLREEYEEPSPERKDKELLFHNRSHTEGVVNRTEQILSAAFEGMPGPGTDRLIELGKLIAAFHDRKNESEIIEVEDGDARKADGSPFTKKIRLRAGNGLWLGKLQKKKDEADLGREGARPLTDSEEAALGLLKASLSAAEAPERLKNGKLTLLGTNELRSADGLAAFLDKQKGADGKPLFGENDRTVVYEALAATVPGWDVKNGTVEQINLNENSSKIARAVALADLGEAGINPTAYIEAGDALVLEDNPDIDEVLRNPGKLDDETKAYVAKRLIAWTESQAGFAVGRKNRLKDELKGFAPDEAGRVEKLFQHFGEDEVELTEIEVKKIGEDGKEVIEKKKVPPYKLKEGVTPKGSAGIAAQLAADRKGMTFDQLRESVLGKAGAHKSAFQGKK